MNALPEQLAARVFARFTAGQPPAHTTRGVSAEQCNLDRFDQVDLDLDGRLTRDEFRRSFETLSPVARGRLAADLDLADAMARTRDGERIDDFFHGRYVEDRRDAYLDAIDHVLAVR